MQKYKNKQELLDEINKTYDLFVKEFAIFDNNGNILTISEQENKN